MCVINDSRHPDSSMNILFLSDKQGPHLSHEMLLQEIDARHQVTLFDPATDPERQFREIDVVIDPGGALGTRELIDAAHRARVRLWEVTTIGVDHVDVEYFLEKGVALANTPTHTSAVAVAEHALAFMFCLAKNLQTQDTPGWKRKSNDELTGRTLGILGFGASGRELAIRASALGMRVMAIDARTFSEEELAPYQFEYFGDPSQLDRLLGVADYLSIHLPLTVETQHLINRDKLKLMKPGAYLINVARGAIVDEVALIDALQSGHLAGAGLDVHTEEPVPGDYVLAAMKNVVTTPHVGGFTEGNWRRRTIAAVENIERMDGGQEPLRLVRAP
jgi:D-3-phosphoglycerate dehydrogenase